MEGLCVRRHAYANSTKGGKFTITALPMEANEVKSLGGDTNAEQYPGIKIHEVSWTWDSPVNEEEAPHIGVGFHPYIRIEGADNNTLEGVEPADSYEIKTICMEIVTKQVLPHYAKHSAEWRDKVAQGPSTWKTLRVTKKLRWPSSRDETSSPAPRAGAGTTTAKGDSSSDHLTH